MNLHTDFKSENQLNQLNYQSLDPSKVALPIHIQNLEKALNLNSFLKQVHSLIDDKRDEKLNLSLSKQSKDVKTAMYSFNKTGKNNKNWLKNILIENSDESDDEDIGAEVEELLKIRKNCKNKGTNKLNSNLNSNLSTNLLSLSDSVPLNSLFKKTDKNTSKNQIKKKKATTSSKKRLKSDDDPPIKPLDKLNENNKLIPKLHDDLKEDDKPYHHHHNIFEPTLNSKAFHNKHDNDLIDAACLDSKLLDDIKYESTLPDDLLQTEANMNDFVNSFLTNMNDQIVYSNQLPDEIFETEEEEISNGFQSSCAYDLNRLTSQPQLTIDTIHQAAKQPPDEQLVIEATPDLRGLNEVADEENCIVSQPTPKINTINIINGSTIKLVNGSQSMISCSLPMDSSSSLVTTAIINPTLSTKISSTTIDTLTTTINSHQSPLNLPSLASQQQTSNSAANSLLSSTNSSKTSESSTTTDAMKLISKSIVVKKKEKTSKSLLEMDPEQLQHKRRKLWSAIAKKDIPKAYKSRVTNRKELLNNCKKIVICCSKERKHIIGIPKLNKESKKTNKEMATYKRNDNQQETGKQQPHLLPKLSEAISTNIISESNQESKSNCLL